MPKASRIYVKSSSRKHAGLRYTIRHVPLQQPQLPSFERQQFFFNRKAAAVSGQLAIRPDHAMARDHNRNWIRSISESDCATGFRITDPSRELTVRNRHAIWNLPQFTPDPLLERSTLWR